jgi:hypothetical protein
MAAIQGLYEQLQEKDQEIASLKAEVEELKGLKSRVAQLKDLEARLAKLEQSSRTNTFVDDD